MSAALAEILTDRPVAPLRLVRPPMTEPRFDPDEQPPSAVVALRTAPLPLPGLELRPPRTMRAVRPRRAPGDDERPSPPSGLAGPPAVDARTFCRRLLPALLDVLTGDRPVAQVSAVLDERVRELLRRRVRHLAASRPPGLARRGRPTIRSLHVTAPSESAVEACATVEREGRCGCLALRLQRRAGGWQVAALEVGWSA